MEPSAGRSGLQRDLRAGRIQGAFQALPDYADGGNGRRLLHADRHGQLQRKDRAAVYRPVPDDRRPRHRRGGQRRVQCAGEGRNRARDAPPARRAALPAKQGARDDE